MAGDDVNGGSVTANQGSPEVPRRSPQETLKESNM